MNTNTALEVKDKGKFIKCLIKGSLIALSLTLIGICIFAFALEPFFHLHFCICIF